MHLGEGWRGRGTDGRGAADPAAGSIRDEENEASGRT